MNTSCPLHLQISHFDFAGQPPELAANDAVYRTNREMHEGTVQERSATQWRGTSGNVRANELNHPELCIRESVYHRFEDEISSSIDISLAFALGR